MTEDYSESPYAMRKREEKAVALEDILRRAGAKADDLVDETVRENALKVLSKERGKRTGASIKTWRLVWRLLKEQETRHLNPFADPFEGIPNLREAK